LEPDSNAVAFAERKVNIQTWAIQRLVCKKVSAPAIKTNTAGAESSHNSKSAAMAPMAERKEECVHFGQRPSWSVKYLALVEMALGDFHICAPLKELTDGNTFGRYGVGAKVTMTQIFDIFCEAVTTRSDWSANKRSWKTSLAVLFSIAMKLKSFCPEIVLSRL
jgi:hypothetical protein